MQAAQTQEIVILAKNATTGEYSEVQGLLDTGSNRNVGSLAKMRPYCKILEMPRRLTQVEFPDLSTKPVKFVGRIEVILKQDSTKLNIGEQVVFLVDDPKWQDLFIGKRVIEQFNLTPDLNLAKGKSKTY